MDDILFRHTAVATPNDKSEEFLSQMSDSEYSQNLVNEAQAFDQFLMDSLKIEVPSDLTDNIFLEQSFSIERNKSVNNRWHIAIAASIAFVIGLTLPMMNNITHHEGANLGDVALQHVRQEYFLTEKVNEHASIENVNVKLARYGASVNSNKTENSGLGHIFFANYCSFEGTSALHLILQGEKGRVTVFVVPADAGFEAATKFNNEHFNGISEHIGNANVVIVGERGEALEKMKEKLTDNIQWEI